jgi:hypothetical protein
MRWLKRNVRKRNREPNKRASNIHPRVQASLMSTDDHTPAHLNDTPDIAQDANINMGGHDHDQPNPIATAVSANPPNGVHPRFEGHDEVTTNHVSAPPPLQSIPQTVPLGDITEPEFGDKEAENIAGGEPEGQKEEIEDQDDSEDGDDDGADEDDEDGDDDETGEEHGEDGDEEDEEEEEEEPALKYERFSGAFQDLLKKDSASALAVSSKFLVKGDVIT